MKVRKNNAQLGEIIWMGTVTLVTKMDRLRWFGCSESQDDTI